MGMKEYYVTVYRKIRRLLVAENSRIELLLQFNSDALPGLSQAGGHVPWRTGD